jgi:hypothetical protein
LADVDEVVKGSLQPRGKHKHEKLDITVEEGDGSVVCKGAQGCARFPRLRYQADDPLDQGGKVVAGGGLTEGNIEHPHQQWDEGVLKGAVELVWQAVDAWR